MKKLYTIAFLIFVLLPSLKSQQLPVSNQYLINRYALSPTYAGINYTEVFLGYRNERINFPGASLMNMFTIDAPLNKNMAFGGNLLYDQTDIFKHLFASISYTYSVKLTDVQRLSFALWGGIYENKLDFANEELEIAMQDPVVKDKINERGTAINSGFGLLYQFHDFRFGIDIPYLVEAKLNYKNGDGESPYKLRRTYVGHMSYPFKIKENWIVEPIVFGRYTLNTPFNWEAAALVKYKNTYWLAMNLRQSMEVGATIGGKINESIILNYSYEFSNKALGEYSTGTHEIGIGYYFGRKSPRRFTPSIPEKELLKQIDSLKSKVERLEKELEQAKENSGDQYQDKIKELENTISSMEGNMNNMLKEVADIREEKEGEIVEKDSIIDDGNQKYYVILDSYRKVDRAVRGQSIWKERGFDTKIVQRENIEWYHLYNDSFDDLNAALDKMTELRDKGYNTVWVLIYK